MTTKADIHESIKNRTDILQKRIESDLSQAHKPLASAVGRLAGNLARRTITFNDLSSIRADISVGLAHIDHLMADIERAAMTKAKEGGDPGREHSVQDE